MMLQGRSFSGHERNCCFLNTGGDRFANISATSGLGFRDDGRGMAVVDWDQDGDLDLWVSNRNAPRVRFLRNDTPGPGHFLAVRLEGNGTTTNLDAIGARVEVVSGENGRKKLIKTLRAGEGFLAQSSKWIHFGLGGAETIEKVIVRWPTADAAGVVEEFRSLEVDRRYLLVQGTGRARQLAPRERSLAVAPSVPELPSQSGSVRIPLVTLLPMPELTYKELDGRDRSLPSGQGRPVLLSLWASWCSPCLVELKEFTERESEIRAAGIDIVALSIDGLEDDRSNPAAAIDLLSRLGFGFSSGWATPGLLEMVQNLCNGLSLRHRPLPVPTSFLIDEQGRLAVIYKGSVSVDDLLQDVTHSRGTRAERSKRSSPLAGRVIEHDQVELSAKTAETRIRLLLAKALQESGRLDDAVAHYLDAVEINPELAEVRYHLGSALSGRGNWPEAVIEFEHAIRLQPDYVEAHNNLGIALASLGDLDGAAAAFERAIHLQPQSSEARKNLGVLLGLRGQWRAAVVEFEHAIRFQPDDAEAHNNLGDALAQQGNLDGAAEEFQRAIRLQPLSAEAHNNLGSVLARQGKWREAGAEFERAVRITPDYTEARKNLRRVQELLEKRE